MFTMMIWETRVISSTWSKTTVGQVEKNVILNIFFLKFFSVFSFKFLNMVCANQNQKSYIVYKEKLYSFK